MTGKDPYQALTPDSLRDRLGFLPVMHARVGPQPAQWLVREVGDGNLNLVFIVEGPVGSVVVKQALPYVRLVGDSWPLPLYRTFYEYHALTRQEARAPGMVPAIHHFDEAQAMIVMEFIAPHRILRRFLIEGRQVADLGRVMGEFCARTAFRGSELCMTSAQKKSDVALFSGNVAIPAITEALVFTDPYFDAGMNHHTPGLEPVIAQLRGDVAMKARVQQMLMRFASNTETMIHGDLHSGSIMATADDVRVIDPEFVQYGPMGFDLGMLVSNFLMAYLSQPAHRGDNAATMQDWILSVIDDCLAAFDSEFALLWETERTGMLFPRCLFEDQSHSSDGARDALLAGIRADAVAFCGIEMHRRCLSLAHNADFEDIDDLQLRAALEARNLMMGRDLILQSDRLTSAAALCIMARDFNERTIL